MESMKTSNQTVFGNNLVFIFQTVSLSEASSPHVSSRNLEVQEDIKKPMENEHYLLVSFLQEHAELKHLAFHDNIKAWRF